MFNKKDEEKRIRKRKAMRLNSSGDRRSWKAGLKNAMKRRDYGLSPDNAQNDRFIDDDYEWSDMEDDEPDPFRPGH